MHKTGFMNLQASERDLALSWRVATKTAACIQSRELPPWTAEDTQTERIETLSSQVYHRLSYLMNSAPVFTLVD